MNPASEHTGGNDELRGLIAAVWNGTIRPSERDRLEEVLAGSEAAQEFYLSCMALHAQLLWQYRGNKNDSPTPWPSAVEKTSPVLGFLGNAWNGASGYLSNHDLFTGYVVATVFFALAALVASHVYVTEHRGREFVEHRGSPSAPIAPIAPIVGKHDPEPEVVSVGRITDTVDCRWVNENEAPFHNKIKLHDKFALKSGLLEITYHTGARVILQGPCTYEVESTDGGYLSLGKLTARVESRSRLPTGTSRSRLPSGTLPTDHDATKSRPTGGTYFSVRTPTATVTDLGTEFGVDVNQAGETLSWVYQGKVEVRGVAAGGKIQDRGVVLGAKESARVERSAAKDVPTVVVLPNFQQPADFVRVAQLSKFREESQRKLFRRWQASSEELRKREDLLAYYDFQKDESDEGVLRNRAATGRKYDGRIEKPDWVFGRFPGKDALRFASPRNNVRIDIPDECPRLTMAAWVRVDSLAGFSSLLMSDNPNKFKQMHWQLFETGEMYACVVDPATVFVNVHSQIVFPANHWRAWRFLAVAYDSIGGKVCFYLNGDSVGEETISETGDSMAVRLGSATIGGWIPSVENAADFRILFGCMEELMIFREALPAEEIQKLYRSSNPLGGETTESSGKQNVGKGGGNDKHKS